MKMNISWIFYVALLSTTFQRIVADEPLSPEQARKLNPETGIYQIYFNEITEVKFNIRLHGENRVEIGCVGYLSHGKWFVRNYLTDVQGYHPIHDLNVPFTVVPESGQSFPLVFIEVLPICGSYYELFLASKDSDNTQESTNEIIQTVRPGQTTYLNVEPTIKSIQYPYTSIDDWNNPTDNSSNEPIPDTAPSTLTDYFETSETRYSETSDRPTQETTGRTPTGYPGKYNPTGPPFKEEPITESFTWTTTPKASTTRPTTQPPPPPFRVTNYPKPTTTPTFYEPNPSESIHREIIEPTSTPPPKIPICIPDIPETIEFGSHSSNHVDQPDKEGAEAPFRISFENCKCTCPNLKKIPRDVLKAKTFDLV